MLPIIIGATFQILVVVLIGYFVYRNVVRVPPDAAVVLSGRKAVVTDPATGERQTKGYRVVTGGSAFRIPMIERIDHLPLSEMAIEVDADDLRDIEGRARSVSLLVNCRITADEPYVDRAIHRFLTMSLTDIENIVRTTIESRVTNTLLTVDLSEPSRWEEVEPELEASIRDDLARLGVEVDTLIYRRIPTPDTSSVVVNGQER